MCMIKDMQLKNFIKLTSIAFFSIFILSCSKQVEPNATQPVADEPKIEEVVEENSVIEEPQEQNVVTEPVKKIPVTPIIKKKEVEVVPEPTPGPVVEVKKEEPPKKEEPKVEVKEEPKQEVNPAMEEYKRSVAETGDEIDYDTFERDKKEIKKIIEDLIVIMKDGDSAKWQQYVEKASITYWSDTNHLASYSKKLPQKGIRMKNLKDYFKWVFVPSRKGQTIDEIRYISNESIKAVQVKGDKDVVYYYFKKENGKWKIHLPTL